MSPHFENGVNFFRHPAGTRTPSATVRGSFPRGVIDPRPLVIILVIDVVRAKLVTWISDLVVISGSIPATINFIELD